MWLKTIKAMSNHGDVTKVKMVTFISAESPIKAFTCQIKFTNCSLKFYVQSMNKDFIQQFCLAEDGKSGRKIVE